VTEEKWTFRYDDANQRLFVAVEGFGTDEKASEASVEFKRLLGARHLEVIFDLEKLTGYSSATRRLWQDCLLPLRHQVARLVVVGKISPIVRMGATVVGAVTGIRVVFFRTLHDVEPNRHAPSR
jgi:hypothetical protein